MKYKKMEDELRSKVKERFVQEGIDVSDFDETQVEVEKIKGKKDKGKKIKFSYEGISFEMPAPSQDHINAWWDRNSDEITKTLLVLLAVGVGSIIKNRK